MVLLLGMNGHWEVSCLVGGSWVSLPLWGSPSVGWACAARRWQAQGRVPQGAKSSSDSPCGQAVSPEGAPSPVWRLVTSSWAASRGPGHSGSQGEFLSLPRPRDGCELLDYLQRDYCCLPSSPGGRASPAGAGVLPQPGDLARCLRVSSSRSRPLTPWACLHQDVFS